MTLSAPWASLVCFRSSPSWRVLLSLHSFRPSIAAAISNGSQ